VSDSPGPRSLTLWLLRHGKAAPEVPGGGPDRSRPLTARGRRDARALGRRLAGPAPLPGLEEVPRPERVVCSAAVRTRQTADLVVEAMGGAVPLDAYRSLYAADDATVVATLREIDGTVTSALFVGHNPAISDVATGLGGNDDEGFLPTCGLAVVLLGVGRWEDVTQGCGHPVGRFAPPY
jgi:phosphohistidine phosphatase